MGQKVNPHGLRVGVIKDWDSRWYARDEVFGDTLVEDYNLRKMLKKQLYSAGVPKIEIERDASKVRIHIHCAKPGMVIGKGGAEIEKLRKQCETMLKKTVIINIVEVRQPDLDAQLVAENIASQLERRISFRRAMKQCIGRSMRLGAKGIKTMVSGRLGGAEIARKEKYHEGTIPLQTIRADIDYGFAEATTAYGKIGVKVWLYKGEVLSGTARRSETPRSQSRPPRDRQQGGRPPRQGGAPYQGGAGRQGGGSGGPGRQGGAPGGAGRQGGAPSGGARQGGAPGGVARGQREGGRR